MFRWIVVAALVALALGTPRSWRRIWTAPADDPWWQPRPGMPFTAKMARRAREEAIPLSLGLALLGIAYAFDAATVACAIALVAIVLPLWASIRFFGQPRRLIPPPLRRQP